MKEEGNQPLNQTDIDGLHLRIPPASRQYHEVQQSQAVQAASSRWQLLAEVRGVGARRRESGR